MSYHKPRGYTDKDGSYKRYGSSSPTNIRRDGYFYEDLDIIERVFMYMKEKIDEDLENRKTNKENNK